MYSTLSNRVSSIVFSCFLPIGVPFVSRRSFFTLEKSRPSPSLGSAVYISTYVSSSTSGVTSSAYVISSLLNTLLKSSAKSGSYSNISAQSCGIGLDPLYPRLYDFSLRLIYVSNFTKFSLT